MKGTVMNAAPADTSPQTTPISSPIGTSTGVPGTVRAADGLRPSRICVAPAYTLGPNFPAAASLQSAMVRCLLAMACVLAATAGWAQPDDRLTSADCRRALDKLQALEAEALAKPAGSARQGVVKELDAQRPEAARLCLGGTGEAPPPSARYSLPMMQP